MAGHFHEQAIDCDIGAAREVWFRRMLKMPHEFDHTGMCFVARELAEHRSIDIHKARTAAFGHCDELPVGIRHHAIDAIRTIACDEVLLLRLILARAGIHIAVGVPLHHEAEYQLMELRGYLTERLGF